MGEREPGRQLDLRDPYVAADLCGSVRLRSRRSKSVTLDTLSPSWPGLSRPSTSSMLPSPKDVDAAQASLRSLRKLGCKRGHDEPRISRIRVSLLLPSIVLALTAAIALSAVPATADPIEDFYKGKTVTIVSSG